MLAKVLAPHHYCDSGEQADADAAGGTNPVIVEGILQEIGNPDQHSGDADTVQPMRANARFEIALWLRGGTWLLGSNANGRLRWPLLDFRD